jgi:hypothetical protein
MLECEIIRDVIAEEVEVELNGVEGSQEMSTSDSGIHSIVGVVRINQV